MLVQSKFETGNIITIKSILGEEIICKYINDTVDNYIITEPLVLGMTQQGAVLMPPIVTGDIVGEILFKKDHAMWVVLSNEEVNVMYLQKTTGIVPVIKTTKIIM